MSNSKQKLAKERTDWAHERTLLAKERTFSAWVRTGLAAMAAGLGIPHLLKALEPLWMVRILGIILILTAGIIFMLGFWSYRKTFQKLEEEGVRGTPAWIIGALTLGLVFGTGIALFLLLLE